MTTYYVYQLVDPRNGKPFYVGKGTGDRAYQHTKFKDGNNNPHKDRAIKKILSEGMEPTIEFLIENISDENRAYMLETQIIKSIGIDNLTNICEDANPPRLVGPANGFYGRTHSEEVKKKLGDVNRGKDIKTSEGKRAIGEAMSARWKDPDEREKLITMLKSRRGEKRSPEAIEAYKKSAKERDDRMSPEQRSQRSHKAASTRRQKYKDLKRQRYIDDQGHVRFRWIPRNHTTAE